MGRPKTKTNNVSVESMKHTQEEAKYSDDGDKHQKPESDSEEPSSSDEDEMNVDESNDEDVEQRTAIRSELSNLTFEELEALKDKLGIKAYNEAMFGTSSKKTTDKEAKKKFFKRTNKNRPREISSKVQVAKIREVVQAPKKLIRDPRFESLCGDFNEKLWDKEYEFLKNIQKKELAEMEQKLKSKKVDPDERRNIQIHLQKLKNKAKLDEEKEKLNVKKRSQREENKKRLEEGKKPFYIKKSTQKYLDLSEKYDELKSSGKLEKYMKKKRKSNTVRDKKTLNFNKMQRS